MRFLVFVFLSALNDTFIVMNTITLMVRTNFSAITDWTVQHCYIRQRRWWLHNSVNFLFGEFNFEFSSSTNSYPNSVHLSFKVESVEGSNVPPLASTILFITSLPIQLLSALHLPNLLREIKKSLI